MTNIQLKIYQFNFNIIKFIKLSFYKIEDHDELMKQLIIESHCMSLKRVEFENSWHINITYYVVVTVQLDL